MNITDKDKRKSPKLTTYSQNNLVKILLVSSIVIASLLGLSFGLLFAFVDNASSFDTGYESGYSNGYDMGLMASGTTYQEAFNDGYIEGNLTGYNDGYLDGYDDGYAQGEEDGYVQGYSDGYIDGYEDGYLDGYDEGFDEGYSNGFSDGYDIGLSEGYDEGYNAGFIDGQWVIKDEGYIILPSSYTTLSTTLPTLTINNGNMYDTLYRDDRLYLNMTMKKGQKIDFGWHLYYISSDSMNDIQNITIKMAIISNISTNVKLGVDFQNGQGFIAMKTISLRDGMNYIDYVFVGDHGYYNNMHDAFNDDVFCDVSTMFVIFLDFPQIMVDYEICLDEIVCRFYSKNLVGNLYTQFYDKVIDGFDIPLITCIVITIIGIIMRKHHNY